MHQSHDPSTKHCGLKMAPYPYPTIQNAYAELWKGSKYVVVVVRNSMAYPQML